MNPTYLALAAPHALFNLGPKAALLLPHRLHLR